MSTHRYAWPLAGLVAGAAGLRVGVAVVAPGLRPRGEVVVAEGRAAVEVALGVALWLVPTGLVEGFVTPSPLPWGLKVAIGALVLAAFWVYVLVLGRRAVAAGDTGDLAEDENADQLPLAA